MRVGAFIAGADRKTQDQRREAIAEYFIKTGGTIDYFTEKLGQEKLDAEDRATLMKAARFCRTHKATFAVGSLKNLFEKRWLALSWLAYQAEQYDMEIVVADEPRINNSSVGILSAQADEQRIRLAAKSKAALDEIKLLLAQGKPVRAKTGRVIEKLGVHDNKKETDRLGNEAQARLARERDQQVWSLIKSYLRRGMNMSEIARQLNDAGVPTPAQQRKEKRATAGKWYPQTIKNIIMRQGLIK